MQYFGGAPGYRELMDGRLPTIPIPSQANRTQAAGVGATKPRSTKPAGADLDLADWLATTEDNILALDTGPLNPAHVLFSEDDYLLRVEPQLTDRAHYLSILQAVAHGATTSANIAAALGRDARSLHHSLNGLERAGF